jgi:Asp-tRNA(Asn)/Glu-tRNA(Gln) amidotransferase A subunit family amidase
LLGGWPRRCRRRHPDRAGHALHGAPIGTDWLEIAGQRLPARPSMGLLTQPVSCIGLPVVTVPLWGCNPAAPHLPIGVQLIAAPWREDLCLRVAAALETQGICSAPIAELP